MRVVDSFAAVRDELELRAGFGEASVVRATGEAIGGASAASRLAKRHAALNGAAVDAVLGGVSRVPACFAAVHALQELSASGIVGALDFQRAAYGVEGGLAGIRSEKADAARALRWGFGAVPRPWLITRSPAARGKDGEHPHEPSARRHGTCYRASCRLSIGRKSSECLPQVGLTARVWYVTSVHRSKSNIGVAMLMGAVLFACASQPPRKAPQAVWTPTLEQLIPADVDIVARIDWRRARDAKVEPAVLQALRDSGLSGAIVDTVEGCLPEADTLRVAVRMGERGLDGDVMAVLTGVRAPRDRTSVPCEAKGWKLTGSRRNLTVFEPQVASADRSAAALMMRSDDGEVVVVTPGQVDALLRVLRDGPDVERLDPKGDVVLVIEARINDAMLPASWRAQAPTLVEVAQGLERGTVRVRVSDRIAVRALLVYVDEEAALAAGEKLRAVRAALEGAEKSEYRSVAESAHASVQAERLQVEFGIPWDRRPDAAAEDSDPGK